MNERFKEILRFRNVKIFRNEIYNLAIFTASEYRQVMQQSVFVFDNLVSTNQDISNNITEDQN
ncbi:13302_t:CDS:1, partial [Entrophospora sp. SA101]